MTVYQKGSGVWSPATQVYIKRNGVWVLAHKAYVKRSGAWVEAFNYDVTPPDPPELSTEIVDNIVNGKLVGRWINVGVRGGPNVQNPDLKLVRVLTDYNGAMPTTPLGGTFTGASDSGWPDEPWSEWRYNEYGDHKDTTKITFKQWPRNASGSVTVKAGTDYHFAAWSQDFAGNWSASVNRTVTIPKATDAANVIVKQTRFQANSTDTISSTGIVAGDLTQQYTPRALGGMWFYGNQIPASIGANGTPTVTNAQIAIMRDANDGGSASCNLYLYHHNYASPGEVPLTGRVLSEITKIGTIAKGESKWFSLPDSFLADMSTNLKGFGLYWKDPAKASGFADDFSIVKGVASNIRSGEVVVTWSEAL